METEETKVETKDVKLPVAEMQAAFPGDAEFALNAIAHGLSVLEAKAEYCDKLLAERDALADELAEMQAAFEETSKADGEDPVEYFEECQEVQFEKGTADAKAAELLKDATVKFGYNDVQALNYIIKNNPEIADQLI